MRYLCARHVEVLTRNEALAWELWHSAMTHGHKAATLMDWRLAQSFYGSALEIAVIRLHAEASAFEAEQLCDAARGLASSLCSLDHFDEAQDVLRYVNNFLIAAIDEPSLPHDKSRALARLLYEFMKRTSTLMRLRGQAAMADSLMLLGNKVLANARVALMH